MASVTWIKFLDPDHPRCIRSPAVRHLLRHQLPSLDLRDPGCSDLGCHLGLEPEARQGPKGPKGPKGLEIWRSGESWFPPKMGPSLGGRGRKC